MGREIMDGSLPTMCVIPGVFLVTVSVFARSAVTTFGFPRAAVSSSCRRLCDDGPATFRRSALFLANAAAYGVWVAGQHLFEEGLLNVRLFLNTLELSGAAVGVGFTLPTIMSAIVTQTHSTRNLEVTHLASAFMCACVWVCVCLCVCLWWGSKE